MNNEAILNKLIELGYVKTRTEAIYLNYFDADGEEIESELFNPEKRAADFELILRALFDVCGKRDIQLLVENNTICLIPDSDCYCYVKEYIYQGDTSRESFIAAFCKVTKIL